MGQIIRTDTTTSTAIATPAALPLDGLILAWLHEKTGRSGSEKTAQAYQNAIDDFRRQLLAVGLDLDSEPAAVALAAQGWASQSKRGQEVRPVTYNQRLAILSSFYVYTVKHGRLQVNPVARVDRRSVQAYADAQPLDYGQLKRRLASIDRGDAAGLRDYALLAVALHTGRRVAELAGLRWGHVSTAGDKVTLVFPRAKGGKVMRDTLPRAAAKALMTWLHVHYGQDLMVLGNDAPLWPVLSRHNTGAALSTQAIADVCQRRLGISKVHTLRHTFARAMEDSGAKVSDIQGRLGHSSLQTTGRYLAALRSAENAHGDALSGLFGIEE